MTSASPSSVSFPLSDEQHPEFTAPDADLVVRSSDGKLFNIHRINLQVHSSVFPPGTSLKADPLEVAEFAESSDVLYILFKYLYPDPPHPDLSEISFPLLRDLAFAAEKYQFISMMVVCDVKMEAAAATNPLAALQYFERRGMNKLLNKTALNTIDQPLSEALRELDGDLFKRWVAYRQACVYYFGSAKDRGSTYVELQTRLMEWVAKYPDNSVQYPVFTDTRDLSNYKWVAYIDGDRLPL